MDERRTRVVALVAAPRSGTHFLHSLLSDHPDVCFYSEVLHDRAKRPEGQDPARPLAFFFQWLLATHGHTHLTGASDRDAAFAQAYVGALRAHHSEAVVGIDLKYWTWTELPKALVKGVEREVDGWIHLIRLDLLRAVASDALRQLRRDHPALPDDVRVRLPDPSGLLQAACRRAAEITAFRRLLNRRGAVELIYEDLFADPRRGGAEIRAEEQARVLEGMALPDPGRPLRSRRRRANPPDLGDRVVNWPELQAELRPRLAGWLTQRGLHDLAAATTP